MLSFFCCVENAHAERQALIVYVMESCLFDDVLHTFRLRHGIHRLWQVGIGGIVFREELSQHGHDCLLINIEELLHGEGDRGAEIHHRKVSITGQHTMHLLQALVKVLEVAQGKS